MLPPPGPERRRLVLMVVALGVIAALYWQFGRTPPLDIPTSTGPSPTAPSTRASAPPRSQSGQARRNVPTGAESSIPQALKLKELEDVPEEPQVGRNPFRFGEPPPPPKPVYVPPPPPVYTPPPAPTPPPIPPIPLKLTTVLSDPYQPGRLRAYLVDPKGTVFEGLEGQIVDGKYKLIRVGSNSVVMSYLDGTGQRTITQGG